MMQSLLEIAPTAETGDLPPLAQLMCQFQSLGDNCEFGLVQRFCGAEPMGLLRFNWTAMPSLLDVLADRFARVGDPDLVAIYQEPSTQYMVSHRPYDFRYHTFLYPADISVSKLERAEVKRLLYLKRALIEDLETGSKILVRKGAGSATLEEILPLLAAIRRYGPAPLLWVTLADGDHPAGLVERLDHGFLHGYVDRFAPQEDIHDSSMAAWIRVCRNAWRLTHATTPSRVLWPEPVPAAENLLIDSEAFDPATFLSLDGGCNGLVPTPPPSSGPLLCHVLPGDADACTGELGSGPAAAGATPGELYVASAQIWVPACYGGDDAGLMITGQRAVRASYASMNRRDCWQQALVSALAPPEATGLRTGLSASGGGGDFLFTTAWKLERGIAPTALRPPTGADRPDPVTDLSGLPEAVPAGPGHGGPLAGLRALWGRLRGTPPPRPPSPRPAPRSLPELLQRFESLGHNCEFGAVQRLGGVEHLAFFRFASAPLAPLMLALESRFDRFGQPDSIAIRQGADGEHMVSVQPYGFEYHTFRYEGEISAEQMRAAEVIRLGFLKRKLIEDLQAGDKIYVRTGQASEADMRALATALRRYGPATLLWVTLEDAANPAGTVLRLSDTLLRGFISRFAPGDAVMTAAVHDWVEICRNADLMWRIPAALRTEGRVPKPRPNLLPEGSHDADASWFEPARGQVTRPPAPLYPGCAVMAHAGGNPDGATPFGGVVRGGLQPGAMHVVSAWVWLPAWFTGTAVTLFLDGIASIRLNGARLDQRETWQRIWTSMRVPADCHAALARLYLATPPGVLIFSTCWKLEPGVVPTDYEPRAQA
jgi:hypothetical protein